eukprot:6049776-Prymnesium_polylepis.1
MSSRPPTDCSNRASLALASDSPPSLAFIATTNCVCISLRKAGRTDAQRLTAQGAEQDAAGHPQRPSGGGRTQSSRESCAWCRQPGITWCRQPGIAACRQPGIAAC